MNIAEKIEFLKQLELFRDLSGEKINIIAEAVTEDGEEVNLAMAGIVGATRARITETLNQLQKQGKLILSHRQIHLK